MSKLLFIFAALVNAAVIFIIGYFVYISVCRIFPDKEDSKQYIFDCIAEYNKIAKEVKEHW